MGFFRRCKPLKDLDIFVGSIWSESGRIEQDRAGLLTLAMGEQDQDQDRDQDQKSGAKMVVRRTNMPVFASTRHCGRRRRPPYVLV